MLSFYCSLNVEFLGPGPEPVEIGRDSLRDLLLIVSQVNRVFSSAVASCQTLRGDGH